MVHPPRRGRYGWRPLVHSGFNNSWTKNGLNCRVIDRVLQIIAESQASIRPSGQPEKPFVVLTTGTIISPYLYTPVNLGSRILYNHEQAFALVYYRCYGGSVLLDLGHPVLPHRLGQDGSTMSALRCKLSGHSLGGALAQLAAHDIATAAKEQMNLRIKVICYTYGSPRVGNHSFAREYDKLVPHTWHLVNDQVSGKPA